MARTLPWALERSKAAGGVAAEKLAATLAVRLETPGRCTAAILLAGRYTHFNVSWHLVLNPSGLFHACKTWPNQFLAIVM